MMQYTRLPVAPTGYKASPNDPEGRPSKQGCEFGWSPAVWTTQEWSFAFSWLVQLAVLIVSAIALAKDDIPEALSLVLILETIVQGVEFAWYTIVGGLYLLGRQSIDVGYRYIDWAISTPIMLISLMFFTLWEANRCVRREDLLGYDGSRVAALIVLVVCDWLMLVVGAAYANARNDGTGLWARIARACDAVFPVANGKGNGIFVGWIWFLGAFAPLFVILGTDHSKIGGQLAVSLSFVVWALYGVVAVALHWAGAIEPATANTLYNLLDLVSKNIAGLVVSIVVLNGEYQPAQLQCTWIDYRPWEASAVGHA